MTIHARQKEAATSLAIGVDFVPRRAGTGPPTEPSPSGPPASVGVPASDPAHALEELRAEHDATCPHCTAVTGHTQTVFGEGNPAAALMFIGEAPGAEEDRTGRPFVGRAGKKLDEMIVAMGLARADVYIANVLKSRPPNNRTPLPDEIAGCSPFLMRQVQIIQPKVIVTLGGPAAKLILNTSEGITRIRGTWHTYDAGTLQVDVMPTFHPAYLLRNYTRETRERVWSDLQAALGRLG
ncbi:MAG: uracil-DNA glycosylase [Phycisphaerales bacterium]|nr:uracil-DNA glycosylase [Phycisphaerales bacterium]